MKKKLIILLILILVFYTLYRTLTITNSKGDVVFGKSFDSELVSQDYSYIFNLEKARLKISVSDKSKILKEVISENEITIFSKSKKEFKVKFADKFNNKLSSYITNGNIISISDIEGNFNVLTKFLIQNRIINNKLNWIFGNGHLVCNGDFFDRGDDVTACLWLIYKLEQEAEKNGGKVHFIIGNHEEMNLKGNEKYVNAKYKALANFLKISYKDLYSKKSELGRWLRTKNAVIKINDILFTHGGISVELVDRTYTLEEINKITQDYIGEEIEYVELINPRASFIFDKKGPFWYRGYFGDYKEYYKETKPEEINKILNYFKVKNIVVGHTVVDKVKVLFNNKVIAIDAMSENDPRKSSDENLAVSCEGLFIDNNIFYRTLFNGKKELLFTKEKIAY